MAGKRSDIHGSTLLTTLKSPSTTDYTPVQDDRTSEEQRPFVSQQGSSTNDGVGKPAAKPLLSTTHIVTCCISLLCTVTAILCVADKNISWHLGAGNRQLIVLGFLLAIMNLCLSTVSPFILLLFEAKFGKSSLQNYNGLLLNQILSPQMTFYWRSVLFVLLALPISLSVAYKSFGGGSSGKHFDTTSFLGTQACYGLFAPPGLQDVENIGVMLFSNATLPFLTATWPTAGDTSEPPLPVDSQAFGFNVLLINENATAFLDIPEPSYVSSVQAKLAVGESWNVSATVYGTVATFDDSKLPSNNLTYFKFICERAVRGSDWGYLNLFMNASVNYMVPFGSYENDNSLAYIGLTPDGSSAYDCDQLKNHAQPFQITRQVCQGTWTITRGGFELKSGSCAGVPVPSRLELQSIVTGSYIILPYWYMSSLAQFVRPFAENGARNGSRWSTPYMATSAAGIAWSRLVFVVGAAEYFDSSKSLLQHTNATLPSGLTYQDQGILYPNIDTVTYVRPTLQKSAWLYLVLSIQSFLTVCMLLISSLLYSIPIGHNFSLISIIAGLDRLSLDIVAGAGLSGELRKEVRLDIRPKTNKAPHSNPTLEYQLSTSSRDTLGTGRLIRRAVYS